MKKFDKIEDYWNAAYQENNLSSLGGHNLDAHIAALRLQGMIGNGMKILCFGVGTGVWIQELRDRYDLADLTVVDISAHALLDINPFCSVAITPETFENCRYRDKFDIAMSLWLSPHMKRQSLINQIQAVIPALKKNGIYAIHYNEPFPGTTFDEDVFIKKYPNEAEALRSGLLRIARNDFSGIVKKAGGIVSKHFIWHEAKDYDELVCVAHLSRA